jgi:hypothetical protein
LKKKSIGNIEKQFLAILKSAKNSELFWFLLVVLTLKNYLNSCQIVKIADQYF